MPMVDNQMAEWIEYYDPVEALAVNMVYESMRMSMRRRSQRVWPVSCMVA